MTNETLSESIFFKRQKPQKETGALKSLFEYQAANLLGEAQKHPEYDEAWSQEELADSLGNAFEYHCEFEPSEVHAMLKKYEMGFTILDFIVKYHRKSTGFFSNELLYSELDGVSPSLYTRIGVNLLYTGQEQTTLGSDLNRFGWGTGIDLCPPQKIFPIE